MRLVFRSKFFNSISNFIGDNHFSLLGNIDLVILLIFSGVDMSDDGREQPG